MEGFTRLINDEQFIQFVLTEYFSDTEMTDEEKMNEVSSSLHDYGTAMDCFTQSNA